MNFFIVSLLSATLLTSGETDRWQAFRGDGSSIAHTRSLPQQWSQDRGVAWNVELPGYGQSSPVVWDGRVFVTSAEGDSKEKSLITCFGLKDGRQQWTHSLQASTPAKATDYISRSAPTPVVDGQRVYAFFETGDLLAVTHEGEPVWKKSIVKTYGEFKGNHSVGGSLALAGDRLLLLIDHSGPSYLLCLNAADGSVVWKEDRSERVSWSSPIVAPSGQRVIVSSNGDCRELDVATGKEIWRVEGLDGNTVPSATVTEELVVVGSGEVGHNMAIRRGGTGDVTDTHVVWRSEDASSSFSSPLVYANRVFMVSRAGVAYCLDLESGRTLWKKRIGDSCWASPVGAGDRVFFFTKEGTTAVVAVSDEFKLLAENPLSTDDRVYGVAATSDQWLVRMGTRLVCLGDK